MRKYYMLLFFVNFLSLSHGQSYLKLDYLVYYDKAVIDSIIEKQNSKSFIIYQSMLQNDALVSDEDENIIASFLIWFDKDTTFIKLITKNLIYSTEKIIGNRVFNYKYVDKTGVELKECTLRFAAPGIAPVNSEIIIYKSEHKKFFFEYGKTSLYIEDKEKLKYRKEFIEKIREEVKLKLGKFKPEKNYLRPPLFESTDS